MGENKILEPLEDGEEMEMSMEDFGKFIEMLDDGEDDDFERSLIDLEEEVMTVEFDKGFDRGSYYAGFFTALINGGMTPKEAYTMTGEMMVGEIHKNMVKYQSNMLKIKEIEEGA